MGDKRVFGAGAGAIGLGGIAAFLGTCCVSPWAVALFGATGAVALARLTWLQPYLLGSAGLLLLAGFWLAYRHLPAAAGGACDIAARRRTRVLLWIAALIVLVLAALAIAATYGFST